MAIRIRVYPQNGGLGMNGLNNGLNGYGQGAVSASTYFNSRLQTQKQVSSLQIGYERQLANERIERVRLEERLKNPYAQIQMASPYGASPYANPLAQYGGVVSPYGMGGYGASLAPSMLGGGMFGGGMFGGGGLLGGLGRFF